LNYDWNHRDLSRTASDNVRARIDGYRLVNQASLEFTPIEALSLELGGNAEYKYSKNYENYYVPTDTVITENNMTGIGLYTYAAFGQFNYAKGKFILTVGSRFTYNELFKNNLSSRITLVYKLGDKNSLKASYGESFRAPSLFEQNFTTTTFTVVGNSDLVPEKSKSIELMYVHSFNKLFLQTTLYHAIYDNTIFRDQQFYEPAGKTVSIYANGNKFTSNGLELELRYINPEILNGFLNLNYIDGNEEDKIGEHYNFKYVPKYTCAIGLSKQIWNFTLSTVLNLKGATEGPNESIDAMYMVNAGLGYHHQLFGKRITHTLNAKNINNSEYLIPEYIRRTVLNSVPYGYFRSFTYTLRFEL
jgi:outer membrane receptor protein involved in Fe transport